MALTNADWAEVLDHTRRSVREAGLADVDRRVTLDFQTTENAEWDFLRYLDGVTSGVKEKSLAGYNRALDVLNSAVRTEDDEQIDEIDVVCVDNDARLYATDRIDLRQAQDFSPLIRELQLLEEYIRKNSDSHE